MATRTHVHAFAKLQAQYNLTDPRQIQMRMIFDLMLQLLESEYGRTPENLKVIARYRRQWSVLEKSSPLVICPAKKCPVTA